MTNDQLISLRPLFDQLHDAAHKQMTLEGTEAAPSVEVQAIQAVIARRIREFGAEDTAADSERAL